MDFNVSHNFIEKGPYDILIIDRNARTMLIGRGYTCSYWLKPNRNDKNDHGMLFGAGKREIPREWNIGILTQSKGGEPDSQVKNVAYSFLLKATKNGFFLSLSILYSLCLTVSDSLHQTFMA